MLGVPWDAILGHGAVSEPVARAMAAGALARSSADIAVSVTGVAGPGGGTDEKPVGLVHFGAVRDGLRTHRRTPRLSRRSRPDPPRLGLDGAGDAGVAG